MRHAGRAAAAIAACAAVALSAAAAQTAGPPRARTRFEWIGRTPSLANDTGPVLHWLPDGSGWIAIDTTRAEVFERVDARTGAVSPLFDEGAVDSLRVQYERLTGEDLGERPLPFRDVAFAAGGRAVLLRTNDRAFRFDPRTRRLLRFPAVHGVRAEDVEGLMRSVESSQLVQGSYAPQLDRVAYVRGYDLYMSDLSGLEVQLTTGGSEEVMHGRPDWLYPEELGQREGYWWSPDATKLAYLAWDEERVERYPVLHELVTPTWVEMQRYARAGTAIPVLRLFVIDLETGKTREIDTHTGAPSPEYYIVRPAWLPDGSALSFQRLDRSQRVLELLIADPGTGRSETVLRDEDPRFVSLHDDLRFLAGGKRLLWSSERSGRRQLYVHDRDGRLLRQLTDSAWPVQRVVGVDERNGWVFFSAAVDDGWDEQMFKVHLDGSHLTCLTMEPGVHDVALDPTATYFTDHRSSLGVPPRTELRATSDGHLVRTVIPADTTPLGAPALESPESLTVTAADGRTALHGLLFRPAGFDSTRRYPLVVSVNDGPRIQRVTDRFQSGSEEARLAQLGFVVWTMDARGTPNRGQEFETATHLALGQADLEDQAAGVRQIARAKRYVDATRVGIYGASYGGYLALMALLRHPELFKAGVAEWSVTDWRNYDATFAERYLRTPEENHEGYELGSALAFARELRGSLLVVYGSADHAVHPTNALQLIDALERAGKHADVMVYPEQRPGLSGVAVHLEKLRARYLLEHL